jgi:hypothetical protein
MYILSDLGRSSWLVLKYDDNKQLRETFPWLPVVNKCPELK